MVRLSSTAFEAIKHELAEGSGAVVFEGRALIENAYRSRSISAEPLAANDPSTFPAFAWLCVHQSRVAKKTRELLQSKKMGKQVNSFFS
mgnify:CR=1 FL=1